MSVAGILTSSIFSLLNHATTRGNLPQLNPAIETPEQKSPSTSSVHPQADSTQSSSQQQAFAALFRQLGKSLHSGNLASAQQTHAALEQDLQHFPSGITSKLSVPAISGSANSAGINVSA